MVLFGIGGLIVGILLLLIGIFLIIFFPSTAEHQPDTFTNSGILLGFISLIIGGLLLFL